MTKDAQNPTTVKVPKWLLRQLKMVQARLFLHGTKSLPITVGTPQRCFYCDAPLTQEEIAPQAHCPACNLTFQALRSSNRAEVTLSLIIGLGVNALLHELHQAEQGGKKL